MVPHKTELSAIVSKLDTEAFSTLVGVCIEGLCGRLETYPDCNLSEEEIKALSNAVKSATETILKLNLNQNQPLPDEWTNVDLKFTELLHQCLEERREDAKLIRKKIILNRASPNLKDYNWDVKWVLGSSNLSSLEQPLASVNFILPGGTSHLIEMTESELDKLIQSLESK
ncbi:Hypothetical predicted protein [Cloeon dipterum]|uniref:COMM domain-containing protein n=1 Tax=Cloeon dipterum TaxID=197152 RepID=A0A8S1C189_9INSE|nr:Hypothetical predicted protein [Cloeon dipterum]